MDGKSKKRHPSLQPLSRHHHHALVVAQMLIKQTDRVESIAAKLNEFWYNGGREHFREEEEYLLPEYAKYQTIDRPEIHDLLMEHIQIRSLVSEIFSLARSDKMMTLGELLRDHVRKEERIVFPMIENGIPEEALRQLQPFFEEHHGSSIFHGSGKESRHAPTDPA